jgi:hypothetical protein
MVSLSELDYSYPQLARLSTSNRLSNAQTRHRYIDTGHPRNRIASCWYCAFNATLKMADVDPAALLSRPAAISTTPILPPKSITTTSNAPKLAKVQIPPRIDVEPIYTALKLAVGEHWPVYKDAVSLFVMGS